MNRIEQSAKQRAGTDAAAKGASRELPVTSYKPMQEEEEEAATVEALRQNLAETSPERAALDAKIAAPFPTRIRAEPGVGGGLADGTEPARFIKRKAQAIAANDDDLEAELEVCFLPVHFASREANE